VTRERLRSLALRVSQAFGFDLAGFTSHVRDVNRHGGSEESCTAHTWLHSKEIHVGIPQRFTGVDFMATLVHELGHAVQGLEHRDMLPFHRTVAEIIRRCDER
jgi:hypothetical protein